MRSPESLIDRIVEAAVIRAVVGQRGVLRGLGDSALLGAVGAFFPLTTAKVLAQEARGTLERKELKIGFLPVACATPLLVADRMGFYALQGLKTTLVKTPGWALVRDMVLNRQYDASLMLAPMPLAASLGVGSKPGPRITWRPSRSGGAERRRGSRRCARLLYSAAGDGYGCVSAAPAALRLHHHLPLPLPPAHHGARAVDRGAPGDRGAAQGRALRRGGALLGQGLRDQLRARRGDRHPDGVPVRHQLVAVLPAHGWSHRPASSDGRRVLLLPGIRLPRLVLVRREAPGSAPALALRRGGLHRIVAVGLLHHRGECLDAAPGRLRAAAGRILPGDQLPGGPAESVGDRAVRAHHERRGGDRRIRDGSRGRFLPAQRQPPRARSGVRAPGSDRGPDRVHPADLPHRRPPWTFSRAAPAGDHRGDGGALQDRSGRAAGPHGPARSREGDDRKPDRRERRPQLPDLRHHARRGERPGRVSKRGLARQHPAPLLRVSHHGRAGDAVRRAHGRLRIPALPQTAVPDAGGPVGPDARLSFPVHRQHRRLADGRAGAAALAGLRPLAHQGRLLEPGLLGQHVVHPPRIHGDVHRPGNLVRAARPAGDPGRPVAAALQPRRCGGRLRVEAPMQTVWYVLVAFMLTAYVVLDGFDLGAGAVHLFIARKDEERRAVLRSIGPVWDGNEVWLIAAGGTLFFAFPALYASSFSGFYLPLNMVLWLLMLRAVGIEFRAHIDSPVWRGFFDGAFSLSSALLALFFGAALGNVVRGVPLRPDGTLFAALSLSPHLLDNYRRHWLAGALIPAAAAASFAALWFFSRRRKDRSAFLASCALLASLLAGVAFALHPRVLPASTSDAYSLTIYNAASGDYSLRYGVYWWSAGMLIAIGYFVLVYRMFRGKVRLDSDGHGY